MKQGVFTIKILKINRTAQDLIRESSVFKSHFTQWRNQRVETIKVIDELQKKLETIHLSSSVVKNTGAALSIAGGLTSLAGIVLAWTGHQTASNWVRNGNIAQGFGAITTASASFAEFGLTKKAEYDIKRVLDKDMNLMTVICKWIQRATIMNSCTQEIFGCNIKSRFLHDALKVCLEIVSFVNESSLTLDEITATVRKQLEGSDVSELPDRILEIALNIAKRIYNNRKLIEPVRNICDILMNNHTLFEIVLVGVELSFLIKSMFNDNDILNILCQFGLSCNVLGSITSRATSDIIGITLNIVTMIFATQDILKGSEYAQKLKKLCYLLNEELDSFDAEFKQLCG